MLLDYSISPRAPRFDLALLLHFSRRSAMKCESDKKNSFNSVRTSAASCATGFPIQSSYRLDL